MEWIRTPTDAMGATMLNDLIPVSSTDWKVIAAVVGTAVALSTLVKGVSSTFGKARRNAQSISSACAID
jgi:hypothetical protein